MDKPEKLIVDGKRLDGRLPDEMRPLKIQAGVLKRADGSAYVELGDNKVLAAVYGPREMHKAVCADCGQECEVPFKPDGTRPVYCRECYAKRRPQRPNRSYRRY